MRATAQSELLRKICATIIKVGGYRLVWVGFVDQQRTRLHPVVQAGCEERTIEQGDLAWLTRPTRRTLRKALYTPPSPCVPLPPNRNRLRRMSNCRAGASCVSCPCSLMCLTAVPIGALASIEQPEAYDATETKLLTEWRMILLTRHRPPTRDAHEQSQASAAVSRAPRPSERCHLRVGSAHPRILDVNDTACDAR